MDFLNEYFQQSKEASSLLGGFDTVRIVMGNVTCDLDSAVCTVVQGYFEYLDTKKMHQLDKVAIIPLMNISRREYVVKTEVVYFFKLYNVSPDLLMFRDDIIDLKELSLAGKTVEVVLVDHHTLPEEDSFLTDSVVKVIDHRPRDANWPWHLRDICIELVGSCATLVARRFLEAYPEFANCRIANLLRGSILIDTCNLSKETERTTPVDIEMLERLEHLIKCCSFDDCQLDDRNTVYSRLIQARSDISKLSVEDLLIKDMKVVDGLPIVAMPMLIRKFLTLEPSPIPIDAICNFALARNTRMVILLGMLNESDQIKRDFCLFSLSSSRISYGYINRLSDSDTARADEIFLGLLRRFLEVMIPYLKNEGTALDIDGKWQLKLFDQTDLTVTRKQIVQILRIFLRDFSDFKTNNRTHPNLIEERPVCSASSRTHIGLE